MVEENQVTDAKEEMDRPVETIEELAKSIKIRQPRPMAQQILVSICFLLGPFLLPLDILFPSLFNFLGFSGLYIFGPMTLVFFLTSIISAKRYS